mmetsp:Transcript_6319/g.13272  ORF Transcript_6319/g.13272 Transcript_6319/m.13272 type:complete len:86 (-) Transcript_6319:8-265(-)
MSSGNQCGTSDYHFLPRWPATGTYRAAFALHLVDRQAKVARTPGAMQETDSTIVPYSIAHGVYRKVVYLRKGCRHEVKLATLRAE